MDILPTHRRLDHRMEICDRGVRRDENAAPNRRADAAQVDTQLKHRCQGGLTFGLARRIATPRSARKIAPTLTRSRLSVPAQQNEVHGRSQQISMEP